MKIQISIPGIDTKLIEFGFTVNCPEDEAPPLDNKWFPLPFEVERATDPQSPIIQRQVILERAPDLSQKEIVPLDFSLYADSLEIEEQKESAKKTDEIVTTTPLALEQDTNSEVPEITEKKIVLLEEDSATNKTQKIAEKNIPEEPSKQEKSKKTAKVAKKIIPVTPLKKVIKKTEPKKIVIKETYEEVVQKISSNPVEFLKVDEKSNRWTEKEFKSFAKTALVTLLLDHPTLAATENGDKIKEKAQKILPNKPSILTNDVEYAKCKERPSVDQILKNNHAYYLLFYDKYFDISYEQILSLVVHFQQKFTQTDMLSAEALFAALALIPVLPFAQKIAAGNFGKDAKVNLLIYCMAYHRSDILIFKEGADEFQRLMLLASDTIKESTDQELVKKWIAGGTKINFDGKLIFEDPRFPKQHKETICNSFDLLLEAIPNDPSIVITYGKKLKNYPLLLKNALAAILLNPKLKEYFFLHKEKKKQFDALNELAKKHLPKKDSQVKNQDDLNNLFIIQPNIEKLFDSHDSLDMMDSVRKEFFDCSYQQFLSAVQSLNELFKEPLPQGTKIRTNWAFFTLIDVIEAMYGVLSNLQYSRCETTTEINIVQLYPKNLRLIQRAIEKDPFKRAFYFADDSIRLDRRFKRELVAAISFPLNFKDAKVLVEQSTFPKEVLNDPEMLFPLFQVNPSILNFGTKETKEHLTKKYNIALQEIKIDSIPFKSEETREKDVTEFLNEKMKEMVLEQKRQEK